MAARGIIRWLLWKLGTPISTPSIRVFRVRGETRALTVEAEDRVFVVRADDRTHEAEET